MNTDQAALLRQRSNEDPSPGESQVLRDALRVGLSIAVAAAVGAIVWKRAGGPLSVRTNVVGSTTWDNFNVYLYLHRFYDVALLVPLIAVVALLLLSRWGPLARTATPVTRARHSRAVESVGLPESDDQGLLRLVFATVLRLSPGALAVYLEVAVSVHAVSWTRRGIAAAFILAVVTVGAGVGYAWMTGARDAPGFAQGVSSANTVAAAIPVLLLGLVSSSTYLTVDSQHRVVHYGWCPWWVSIALALALAGFLVWRCTKCPGASEIRALEGTAVLLLAGSVVVFLLTAVLPGALGNFTGFDDAQAVVGAKLMFHQGLWPWKNILLLHGFLPDGVYGQLGLNVFSNTYWGSVAGNDMLIQPVACVGLYLFVVYFSRRSMHMSAIGAVVVVWAPLVSGLSSRYLLVLPVLILMDRVIRSGTWWTCAGFISALILTAIVVPETTILMLGVLGTLVLSDLVRWWSYRPQSRAFATTLRCAVSGVALVAVWVLFLAASGAWSGFVSYYLGTISGHELWGAFAIPPFTLQQLNYFVYAFMPVVLFLATIWRFVWKLRTRRTIGPREWVLAATATFVPLFYPVFLDRPDMGHAIEMFAAVTPLVLLWGMEVISWLNAFGHRLTSGAVVAWYPNRGWRGRSVAELGSAVALVALAALYSSSLSIVRLAGARYQPHVSDPPVAQVPLGYQVPGATDVQQIVDLRAVLARYTGTTGPMFDFANEMGVDYFLMNYVPGARYYHVEAAQTLRSQEEEISDLSRSKPKVVIYFDTYFGIPLYDNIIASVRNYQVSQYLLDHYTPVIDLKGQLIMIRNDLAGSAPTAPSVTSPTVTSDLYFQMPHCDWGYTPNFFDSPPQGELKEAVSPNLIEVSGNRYVMELPKGSTWSNFQWLELISDHALPLGTVTITDLYGPGNTHDITFKVLRRSGNHMFVRVGSCIQWHGYRTNALSILTSVGTSGLSARLLP